MTPERSRALRGLYAITPELADTEALLRLASLALQGGAAALQYRAKSLPPGVALLQARGLRDLCTKQGALFIVNDSTQLALAVAADGVHLGRDDESVRAARILFPRGLVGASCYGEPERARLAAQAGADYVAIGSVFASGTKPSAVRAPLQAIGRARELSGLPVVAIGGITPANAPQAIAAGADMVAVISAVFDAADVRAAAAGFATLFECPIEDTRDVRAQPRAV